MKLYISNPHTKAVTTIYEINSIISNLNNLFSLAEEYNRCTEENQKLRSETLPIYEEQEQRSALILTSLETKRTELSNKLRQASNFHVIEKKKLQIELQDIENQIGLHYNNYSRAKSSVSAIICKITENESFIDSHPLLATIHSHQLMVTKELNPAIKKLSKLIKTPLVTYNPTSMFYIEKFEFYNEDKFEQEL